MARDSGSFWSTVPGFFTALGAFIGSIAALVTALNGAGILLFPSRPAAPAPQASPARTATTTSPPAAAPVQDSGPTSNPEVGTANQVQAQAPTASGNNRADFDVPFNARYEGFSTEGAMRSAVQTEFKREGNLVYGIYIVNGLPGQIQGTVSGNQLSYAWRWGNYFGRGLASEQNGTIQGTWGYGYSANNAGTLFTQRSRP